MITGGEIQNEWDKLGFSITPPGIAVFARAIYQLGRQHQRESDAALVDHILREGGGTYGDAVLANSGELK